MIGCFSSFSKNIFFLSEGMRFVDGVLEHSDSTCRTDGNQATVRTCWPLTSRWIAGDARLVPLELTLRFKANEHRRKSTYVGTAPNT